MYFDTVENLQQLKSKYREFCQRLHPDKGGKVQDFVAMRNEYELAAKKLASTEVGEKHKRYDGSYKTAEEIFGEQMEYRDKVERVIVIPDIVVELCGNWLWITGETKPYKDVLKAAGFKWAAKKAAWYWHSGEWHRKYRKRYSLNDIRLMHGSTLIQKDERLRITA